MNNNSLDSFCYNENTEPTFLGNIMIQKIEKKHGINLSAEILKRKKIFNHMLNDKFGHNFFNVKPESYVNLVNRCKTFYFSPDSKFLNHFPKLRSKLLFERKINYDNLSSKIDIGNLLYLSEARKKKYLDQNDQKNERLINFSKNFSSQNTKDVISNEIYKVKFWKKNSKKINRVLSNRFEAIFKKLLIKENEKNKNILTLNLDKNKENNKFEKNNNSIKENNRYNPIRTYYNNIPRIKNDAISSVISDKNSLQTISFSKINKNESDINNIKSLSRNNKILKLKTHNKTTMNSKLGSSIKDNSNSFDYKKNINEKVKELNSQTKICNNKLYTLINNNHSGFPEKIIENSQKDFDINYSLSENCKNISKWKLNHKGTFSYITIEKLDKNNEKKMRNEKIGLIVKEAKSYMSNEDKFKKRELKLLPKKIFWMKDDFALQTVERLFSKENLRRQKIPQIKNIIKELNEIKEQKRINLLRNKAKYNHDKIIRMSFYLSKKKENFILNFNKKRNKQSKKKIIDKNKKFN